MEWWPPSCAADASGRAVILPLPRGLPRPSTTPREQRASLPWVASVLVWWSGEKESMGMDTHHHKDEEACPHRPTGTSRSSTIPGLLPTGVGSWSQGFRRVSDLGVGGGGLCGYIVWLEFGRPGWPDIIHTAAFSLLLHCCHFGSRRAFVTFCVASFRFS